MMFKKIYGRIIAANCAIFLAIFAVMLLLTVQGTFVYFSRQAEQKLLSFDTDASRAVAETMQIYGMEKAPVSAWYSNADYFCDKISIQSGLPTTLFDNAKNVLSSSAEKQTDFSAALEALNEDAPGIMMYQKEKGVSTLQYVTLIHYRGTPVGALGFVYSLEKADRVINECIVFFMLSLLIALPLVVFCSVMMARAVSYPVNTLTGAVKEINSGHYDHVIPPPSGEELSTLTAEVNQLVADANKSISRIESDRKRFARVFAALDDGVLAVDHNGRIILDNPYIRKYLGIDPPANIYDLACHAFIRDAFEDLRGGKPHVSFEVECNDRELLIIGSPLSDDPAEKHYLIIIRNVTTEYQIQNEQHKFISAVSHELRTPLTTIIGYTDMLTRRNITDGAVLNRSLTTINREGHRLLRLVDDLINVNRLEHIEFAYHKTTVDLNALLKDVVEQMNIKAHSRNITIVYKIDSALPPMQGDYDRLSQLFINIIHNAVKYSNNGDVVDVVAALEGGQIVTSVRDYGVGIPEGEQKKVFSAFYRVDENRARSDNEGGAGLGLFLVKQIVEHHNGTIDVRSVLNEGTIFTITFPVETPEKGGNQND